MSQDASESFVDIAARAERPIRPDLASEPDPAPDVVTFDIVRSDPEVEALVERANENLGVLGYTEHGVRHVTLVSRIARNVLRHLGYDQQHQELASIAGYLHDIGNVIARHDHPQSSALLVLPVLTEMGMDPTDIALSPDDPVLSYLVGIAEPVPVDRIPVD